MKIIDSIEELKEENFEPEITGIWEAFAKNLCDQFKALNLDVEQLVYELKNGEPVFRSKVETIFKATLNDEEDEISNKKNRENCQWILDRLFLNHLVPKTVEGAFYTVPNEFWYTSLGKVIKAILYPELNKEKEDYFPISAKEAADILGITTQYLQKIAVEEFEGKKLSSGWIVNLRRVLEYKNGGSGKDMIVTVEYGITDQRYKQHLIEAGKSIEKTGKFETTLSSFSPKIRKKLVEATDLYDTLVKKFSNTTIGVMHFSDENTEYQDWRDPFFEDRFMLDKDAEIETLFLNNENVEEYLEKFLEWHKKRCVKHQKEDNEHTEIKNSLLLDQQKSEQEHAAKMEKEKEDWIIKNGSQHLQKLYKLNFPHEERYASERAKLEFPDYTINFERYGFFRDEYNDTPSEQVLDELVRIQEIYQNQGGFFVPNAILIYNETGGGPFVPVTHGVALTHYLGKYTLIREFPMEVSDDDLPF